MKARRRNRGRAAILVKTLHNILYLPVTGHWIARHLHTTTNRSSVDVTLPSFNATTWRYSNTRQETRRCHPGGTKLLSAFSRSATLAGGANAITEFIRCSLPAKETSDTTQVFSYSNATGIPKKYHFCLGGGVPRFRPFVPFVPLRTALRVQDMCVALVLYTDRGKKCAQREASLWHSVHHKTHVQWPGIEHGMLR
jgi:hypothetical protein